MTPVAAACEDMKLDFPGEVYDGEWRSSFFYVENGTCKTFRIQPDTRDDFTLTAKLRNGTSAEFFVRQQCPDDGEVFLTAGFVIAALFIAALAYARMR